MTQQYFLETAKTGYTQAPIWRALWSVKIKVQSRLLGQLESIWKCIIANLNIFTVSIKRERLLMVYMASSYCIENNELVTYTSKLEVYSTGRLMLNYRAMYEYMKQAALQVELNAGLVTNPYRVLDIAAPLKDYKEIIQINQGHLICSRCEDMNNLAIFLNNIIRSDTNLILCKDDML